MASVNVKTPAGKAAGSVDLDAEMPGHPVQECHHSGVIRTGHVVGHLCPESHRRNPGVCEVPLDDVHGRSRHTQQAFGKLLANRLERIEPAVADREQYGELTAGLEERLAEAWDWLHRPEA